MRFRLLYFHSLLFLSTSGNAQTPSDNWEDSSRYSVALQNNMPGKKILKFDATRPAIIYFTFDDIRNLCLDNVKNKEEYKDLLIYFDSASFKNDTITFTENNNGMNELISDLLKKGSGSVYDRNQKRFADTIYHRQEKYAAEAWRFFYFPDKRSFFGIMEFSGIMEEEKDPMKTLGKHAGEYNQLADRLKRIWKKAEKF